MTSYPTTLTARNLIKMKCFSIKIYSICISSQIDLNTRVKINAQVVVFALLVPSCGDKSGTSCYHLVTDLLQVVLTRLIQAVGHELVVINLLPTCYVQTISNLLEQLVASLLGSSILLQDYDNMYQICQQLHGNNIVDKL